MAATMSPLRGALLLLLSTGASAERPQSLGSVDPYLDAYASPTKRPASLANAKPSASRRKPAKDEKNANEHDEVEDEYAVPSNGRPLDKKEEREGRCATPGSCGADGPPKGVPPPPERRYDYEVNGGGYGGGHYGGGRDDYDSG
eukprot:CAMPEP_0172533052 /NCGR_PEP_ID=MMETSP1067-20121228/5881_1 /TAXON_ID=265564 ORGANISM="Thalassiosira punctigera, Strain Tpunct2005C2" /NCGR_SAMPLE_ID=MMETSP1067 /ASSEMBLY_ACC=CAM_ASM_000444 /LENGTH=143 /DNA_ID=CAMNT_0013317637 /DNA_START=7 /DNA_END=434 /DNA_ORIENTATION=+